MKMHELDERRIAEAVAAAFEECARITAAIVARFDAQGGGK